MQKSDKPIKYIVVTGGVLSGLGKGIATAAIGRLIKADGLKIVSVKCDGYLNVDPGTMNPFEHGEVFVLDDGGEVDMDFGHYERFLDTNCKFKNNLTSGKMFQELIDKERRGDFLGKTVQVIPHFVDHITDKLTELAEEQNADILTIEVGGTVGDIENSWFIEAVKRLKRKVGKENIVYVHLTYVPYLDNVGELKTKPAQRDIAMIRSIGIHPDIIICRSKTYLSEKQKEKIADFCEITKDNIISGIDVDSIYKIPVMFADQGLTTTLIKKLDLKTVPSLDKWKELVNNITNAKQTVNIAICGKYTGLEDSYASVKEALIHAGANLNANINVEWVETTELGEENIPNIIKEKNIHGILVPGGFGSRGTEGKISMVKYARENNLPYLGICYGLQLAVIEFARNVCKLKDANSTEINENTPHPVVDILPEQKDIANKGATMRLGAYLAVLTPNTFISNLYDDERAIERHRHRYEVNPEYHEILSKHGLVFAGASEDKRLVEFIELKDHPCFVAGQGHNEFTSRLERPNPLFFGFVRAAVERLYRPSK